MNDKHPTVEEQAREYAKPYELWNPQKGDIQRVSKQSFIDGHASRNSEVEELKKEIASMKVQISAYKNLQQSGDKIRQHQSKLLSEAKTVDSEREANELLTNENEALKERIKELEGLVIKPAADALTHNDRNRPMDTNGQLGSQC